MPDRMELHCNLKRPRVDSRLGCRFLLLLVCARVAGAEQPASRWIELRRDERGPGAGARYAMSPTPMPSSFGDSLTMIRTSSRSIR